MNYLVSIHPHYCDEIFSGRKNFEVRSRIPRLNVDDVIFVYATAPISKVVGHFVVSGILQLPPMIAWESFKSYLQITPLDFGVYTQGLTQVFLIQIGKTFKYETPSTLSEFGIKSAPQWFVKLKDK